MAISDLFKTNSLKAQIDQLKMENVQLRQENASHIAQITRIQNSLSPEEHQSINLKNKLNELQVEIAEKESEINHITDSYQQEARKLAQLRKQVLVQNELIELEEFSLYEPRYQFQTSEEYKKRLDTIRDQQKQMIKQKRAVVGNTNWTVNDSLAQGQKMVNDMKALCLRAFNVECDSAISGVRFNNVDRCEKRIKKSFDAIIKLGTIMNVQIVKQYYELKLQELYLAHEYAVKKQDEKDRLREIREQEREAARAQKELEEARKYIIKEQQHYQSALEKVKEQLSSCSDQKQRVELSRKYAEIQQQCESIDHRIQDIDYRAANQKAGYVYVISNIGAFGENVYKIGMTRRLEPSDRIDELSGASVPFKFDIHAMIFSDDAPALEARLHQAFEKQKVNMVNSRKEFFHISLSEIKRVIHGAHDKTVEFIEFAPAEHYRESMKIRNALSISQ